MKFFYNKKTTELTATERYVLAYIEEHPDEFLSISITEFAKSCGASIASITILSQKLGFAKLKDMQIHVAKEMVRNKTYEIEEFDGIESYVNNINIYIRHAVDSTAEQLKKQDLVLAIEKLNNAKEIYTFGIGASRISSSLLADNLSLLGKNVKKMNSIHDLVLWLKLENKKDVVIVLFSNTLKTREINDILNICNDYEINTIVISANEGEYKKENFTYIHFNPFERETSDGLTTFTPKFSQMFIVDVITSYMKKYLKNERKRISNKYLVY